MTGQVGPGLFPPWPSFCCRPLPPPPPPGALIQLFISLYFQDPSQRPSVSDSGHLHVTLPATAPLGSDFAISIVFSNLAALSVGSVNMSVVAFPSLLVSCLAAFGFDVGTLVIALSV